MPVIPIHRRVILYLALKVHSTSTRILDSLARQIVGNVEADFNLTENFPEEEQRK
jgi:hypothetical protein